MATPLEGVRVLELTRVAPGTYATMMLADMGAEVIRIETPPEPGKIAAPGISPGKKDLRQAVFNHTNRNKQSIALNMKAAEGQRVFQEMAKNADVVVEGFRPGVMKRLGGDYETISKLNPRVIYCSMSGYGPSGPYKDLAGHDINYLSFGGVLNLIGEADRPPSVPLNIVADYASATMHTVIGILLALMARDRTGRGQEVDVSYMDGVIALLAATPNFPPFFRDGKQAKRGLNALGGTYPYYGVFECQDGRYITLGCMEPHFWERTCKALGREDLASVHFTPQHFVDPPDAKSLEVAEWLRGVFKTKPRDEWFDFFLPHDICIGKVYALDEVFQDPQVRHREMYLEVEHPTVGKVPMVGVPIKLSDTPGRIKSLGPYLGEHTEHILSGLGYDAQAIAGLKQQGVVV
ncbi:MAG: CoA transferase [Dehalococcoidia bacterium]|nr:CoA transferase [Dehalococcoidia bacterium]